MTSAIILAAGSSTRMGGVNKQLSEISGIPVFVMSALRFQRSERVGEIIIAAPAGETEYYRETALRFGVSKLKAVTEGGATRFLSVKNALERLSPNTEYVAIHDGARPLIPTEEIDRVIADAERYGAALAAAAATDTVKTAANGFVNATPPRETLYYAQTPQVFRTVLYKECVSRLGEEAEQLTDDSLLFERCGIPVRITPLTCCNMKITRPDDLAAAQAIYSARKDDLL